MMHKKAVELTMNTLIMAILGIVVLFVLIMIFTGKITWFGGQYQDIGQRTFACAETPCLPPGSACPTEKNYIPFKKCYTDLTFKTLDEQNNVCCETKMESNQPQTEPTKKPK